MFYNAILIFLIMCPLGKCYTWAMVYAFEIYTLLFIFLLTNVFFDMRLSSVISLPFQAGTNHVFLGFCCPHFLCPLPMPHQIVPVHSSAGH